jgi:hypothetical protein
MMTCNLKAILTYATEIAVPSFMEMPKGPTLGNIGRYCGSFWTY